MISTLYSTEHGCTRLLLLILEHGEYGLHGSGSQRASGAAFKFISPLRQVGTNDVLDSPPRITFSLLQAEHFIFMDFPRIGPWFYV
ncbi:predicted protein [Sclerotinia sclerotiorum 1980 UF-70]|uniref:Uncharacterized protein n=1 Tax=Sclerotinia sclerotiorum (strain ATCC 18683 / 1980 / Ss-1) TaxID=665079 RepID=A7F1K4_SCLS1|nr:predicted protein [Sclerotinia sclerotiorum 1980 UF-70]EDN95596.1 predicted protein [Sclerotinia sclerotiorum 1980 UF-70]